MLQLLENKDLLSTSIETYSQNSLFLKKEKLSDDEICNFLGYNKYDNDLLDKSNKSDTQATTTQYYQKAKKDVPLFLLENKLSKMNSFRSLQKWEGVVLEVNEDTFRAELFDLTNKGYREEAEIFIEEISPDDRVFLTAGNKFYWHIGYYDRVSGERTRESFIRFVRLPKWSKLEIKLANLEADKLQKELNW